jgi:hypothetical protein
MSDASLPGTKNAMKTDCERGCITFSHRVFPALSKAAALLFHFPIDRESGQAHDGCEKGN